MVLGRSNSREDERDQLSGKYLVYTDKKSFHVEPVEKFCPGPDATTGDAAYFPSFRVIAYKVLLHFPKLTLVASDFLLENVVLKLSHSCFI